MNLQNSKRVVDFLCREWNIPTKKTFILFAEIMNKGVFLPGSGFSGFEFSFIPGKRALRLLHLSFYRERPNNALRVKTALSRHAAILTFLGRLNKETDSPINIEKVCALLKVFKNTKIPSHMALKFENNQFAISLYFSTVVSGKASPSRKDFLDRKLIEAGRILERPPQAIKEISESDFNVIGVDFFGKKTNLKIYSYCDNPSLSDFLKQYNDYLAGKSHYGSGDLDLRQVNAYFRMINFFPVKQSGILYRISEKGIDSLKLWARFKYRVGFGEFIRGSQAGIGFEQEYSGLVSRVCGLGSGGIIYFALENGRPNVYLR